MSKSKSFTTAVVEAGLDCSVCAFVGVTVRVELQAEYTIGLCKSCLYALRAAIDSDLGAFDRIDFRMPLARPE
jgi:hypothetical protein